MNTAGKGLKWIGSMCCEEDAVKVCQALFSRVSYCGHVPIAISYHEGTADDEGPYYAGVPGLF